ncbi:MAG: hypothetical protein AAGB34_08710, partial [Planctomycetota bacterium]
SGSIPPPSINPDASSAIAASPFVSGPDQTLDPTAQQLAYTSGALAQSDLIEGMVIEHVIRTSNPRDIAQCRIALLNNPQLRAEFERFADTAGGIGLASSATRSFYDLEPDCSGMPSVDEN